MICYFSAFHLCARYAPATTHARTVWMVGCGVDWLSSWFFLLLPLHAHTATCTARAPLCFFCAHTSSIVRRITPACAHARTAATMLRCAHCARTSCCTHRALRACIFAASIMDISSAHAHRICWTPHAPPHLFAYHLSGVAAHHSHLDRYLLCAHIWFVVVVERISFIFF